MHDPVAQTGEWLRSVVQGYFNYHAVPGNLDSLGAFRDRVTRLWRRTLRRRGQKRPPNWTRLHRLAERWIPQPRVLHPYPELASPPVIRDKSLMREIRTWGSVRGVPGNRYPYRDRSVLSDPVGSWLRACPTFILCVSRIESFCVREPVAATPAFQRSGVPGFERGSADLLLRSAVRRIDPGKSRRPWKAGLRSSPDVHDLGRAGHRGRPHLCISNRCSASRPNSQRSCGWHRSSDRPRHASRSRTCCGRSFPFRLTRWNGDRRLHPYRTCG